MKKVYPTAKAYIKRGTQSAEYPLLEPGRDVVMECECGVHKFKLTWAGFYGFVDYCDGSTEGGKHYICKYDSVAESVLEASLDTGPYIQETENVMRTEKEVKRQAAEAEEKRIKEEEEIIKEEERKKQEEEEAQRRRDHEREMEARDRELKKAQAELERQARDELAANQMRKKESKEAKQTKRDVPPPDASSSGECAPSASPATTAESLTEEEFLGRCDQHGKKTYREFVAKNPHLKDRVLQTAKEVIDNYGSGKPADMKRLRRNYDLWEIYINCDHRLFFRVSKGSPICFVQVGGHTQKGA